MSHLKQRAEKICLNCNAQLEGPYCHICGQENIEPKESVWYLITHFFNDITHFDGKFFSTLGLLIKKPGFLSREYRLGRRAGYLNPIRMYIFTSALFFLIFFSFVDLSEKNINAGVVVEVGGKTPDEIRLLSPDSLKAFTSRVNGGKPVAHAELGNFFDSIKSKEGFHLTSSRYRSKQQYDSVLKAGVKKHNWLERKIIYKEIEANQKYQNNSNLFLSSFLSAFIHSFPKMLFISLPIFALFLQLLYKRQKDQYYVSHGIFSIHLYIFIFIIMLLMFGLSELRKITHWEWLGYLRGMLGISIFFYCFQAMRNFYQQGWGKTFVKFLLLTILSGFMIALLFIVFLLFSFMKI
ncbi:MAG: DUF3667 domain-containing protein [Ferruginibacter sp.]